LGFHAALPDRPGRKGKIVTYRPLIVGLGGTTRPNSSSENATRAVLRAAEKIGARTEMYDGAAISLPMYAPESPDRAPQAVNLVQAMRRADGIVLGSPGYHGSVSGLLKNALDYTEDMRGDERVYFEGRAIGCIVCAAGWQAVGTTLTSMRSIVHALRGWPTPLGVGINTVEMKPFDQSGDCILPNVQAQFDMLAKQVVEFAQMLNKSRS
jgi:FMN reductase